MEADQLAACHAMSRLDADRLLLPYFTGWTLNVGLLGAVLSAALTYWSSEQYARDSRGQKAVLWTVVLLDVLCGLGDFYLICYWGSEQDRSAEKLYSYTRMDVVAPVASTFIAVIVQTFLARRAAHFISTKARRRVFLAAVGILITLSFLASTALNVLTVFYFYETDYLWDPWTSNKQAAVWLCLSAATDIVISVVLFKSLEGMQAGFNASTNQLLRLVGVAGLTTASYTSFFCLIGAVLSAVFWNDENPYANIFVPFFVMLPGLYALSLIATLNTRQRVKNMSRNMPKPGATTGISRIETPGLDMQWTGGTSSMSSHPPQARLEPLPQKPAFARRHTSPYQGMPEVFIQDMDSDRNQWPLDVDRL